MSIFNMDYVRAFYQICLSIDVLLYKLIGSAFQIFNILSEARLFSSETIGRFTSRVYLIVSVVMLFILAYSFLTVIINPDNMTKGNSSPGKIVKNILVALVVLVFTPTAFNYAYGFQTSLIKNNVVGKIVIGADKSDDIYAMSGEFATTVFTGSYYLAEEHSEEAELYYNTAVMSSKLENNIGAFVDTIPYVQTGDIEYNYVISTIVGAFVLYILVTFVFDLGLRAVKLAFLELFAPVPALLYMIPGKEKSLNTWFKDTLQTFFEVFVRIGILFFCIYLIAEVDRSIDNILGFNQVSGFMVRNICRIFVIIGILLFAKQAPQLICDILGIKNEGGLLSLKKRLKDSGLGAFAGGLFGGAVGAVGGVRGAYKYAMARGANKGERAFGMLSGAFHGARLGSQAGAHGDIQGIGNGYKYAAANQKAWAHMPANGDKFKNWVSVQFEMLRDNFGIPSYYDDLVGLKETETNAAIAGYNKSIQDVQAQNKAKVKELDDQYGFTNKESATKLGIDAGNDVKNDIEKEVTKQDYGETVRITTVKKDEDGNWVKTQDNISYSQFDGLKKMYAELKKDQLITNEDEQLLLAELERGSGKLNKDFAANQIVAKAREDGEFRGMTDAEKLSSTYANDFINGWVESSKKMYDYTQMEDAKKHFESVGDTERAAAFQDLIDDWTLERENEARDKFRNVISNTDDYKVNQKIVNEINKYRDIVNMTGTAEAGLVYDKDTQQFIQDKKVAKIKQELSGDALFDSIKFMGISSSNLQGFKDDLYRQVEITYTLPNGRKSDPIPLNQSIYVEDSMTKEVKKLQDELKDFKLAYADEEFISNMAKDTKKYRGFRHPKK